jgi:hypothetical protein
MRWIEVLLCSIAALGCRAKASSGPTTTTIDTVPAQSSDLTPRPTPAAPEELADQEQVESLLNNFHARFCEQFHLVSHRVVAQGIDDGMPAQLVAYKATAKCFSISAAKLCGKIALSFDAEWNTYRFVSGFNFATGQGMDELGGGCDDESKLRLNCFGCGHRTLATAMKKNGFTFVPAAGEFKGPNDPAASIYGKAAAVASGAESPPAPSGRSVRTTSEGPTQGYVIEPIAASQSKSTSGQGYRPDTAMPTTPVAGGRVPIDVSNVSSEWITRPKGVYLRVHFTGTLRRPIDMNNNFVAVKSVCRIEGEVFSDINEGWIDAALRGLESGQSRTFTKAAFVSGLLRERPVRCDLSFSLVQLTGEEHEIPLSTYCLDGERLKSGTCP